MKTRVSLKMEAWGAEKKADVVGRVRAKHYDRWMERMAEIGRPVSSPEDIDYTD